MSDYDFRPGGSLKLKGGVTEGGIVKKWKSHSKVEKERERERAEDTLRKEEERSRSGTPSGSNKDLPAVSGSNEKKTEAEKRFEAIQRQRMATRVAKLANKTHKDRVNEFNAKLEALSEHHDIPKVIPSSRILATSLTTLAGWARITPSGCSRISLLLRGWRHLLAGYSTLLPGGPWSSCSSPWGCHVFCECSLYDSLENVRIIRVISNLGSSNRHDEVQSECFFAPTLNKARLLALR
ncbi:DUF1754-domain-containing protein [Punctularia strigosozonata HHB-11173 SS5]|uniref:DUF1754-domain-containing protein n=1 Tax=Punctularia strigosozonata (strain HHB-11173) TaxID=741275 RepID=UPI0004418470|nr:DUF1754-domain-containing protein [Punctularia strigosozonata HHB-11173 SS5]EIN13975.1 DUF1754-domain-containing protein [Punctularia strigosozonata HHB-11173 SS5]